jgi:hypothetical protein
MFPCRDTDSWSGPLPFGSGATRFQL